MYYKVYLVLAHKNPIQLYELIELLSDGKSIFFIHLDKKNNSKAFNLIHQLKNCYFIKNNVKCNWGDFSLVKATLNSLSEINAFMAVNHPSSQYHCIFLSGEDLPLKNNNIIHNFLSSNIKTSYVHHWKLPYKNWWGGGMFRFESVFYVNFLKYPKLHKWLNYGIKKCGLKTIIPLNRIKKEFPTIEIYGNSQWMILTKDLIKEVLLFSQLNSKFNSIFNYVFAPDELYFSTLIKNLADINSLSIENIQTHLVIFNDVAPNPIYLTINDIQNNTIETTLFARKFDNKLNSDAINYIKTLLKQ